MTIRDDDTQVRLSLKTGKPGMGTSDGASQRRMRNSRDILHSGASGELIEMSGNRKYRVAADGSFRRIKERAA